MSVEKQDEILEAMVDIETLDTDITAQVFKYTIVLFSSDTMDSAPIKLVIDKVLDPDIQQELFGRTRSTDTFKFWTDNYERKAIYNAAIKECQDFHNRGVDLTPHAVLYTIAETLSQFMREASYNIVINNWWARGQFDFPILTSLYRQANFPTPWSNEYWKLRELRTLADELGVAKVEPAVPHDSYYDCLAQIKTLITCRHKLARWQAIESTMVTTKLDVEHKE